MQATLGVVCDLLRPDLGERVPGRFCTGYTGGEERPVAKASPLYQTISEAIRRDILEGRLQRGDRLPPVRKMTERWGCAPGTVQRAYQELARQGLVVSRHGRGTQVTGEQAPAAEEPLRRAGLVHRAEAFLLEALTAGFDLDGVEQAFRLALDRWRSAPTRPEPAPRRIVRFAGSHDLALDRQALGGHDGGVSHRLLSTKVSYADMDHPCSAARLRHRRPPVSDRATRRQMTNPVQRFLVPGADTSETNS